MKLSSKTAVLAASLAVLPAFAEVKINEQLAISGYASAAAAWTDPKPGNKTFTGLDSGGPTDSAYILMTGKYEQFSGAVGGIVYPNRAGDEADVLDAYVTYDAGSGFSITGGKWLSSLGYESFHAVYMTQLSYSNSMVFSIPGYHTGAKLDYADKDFSVQVGVVDSLFNPAAAHISQGDGEFGDDVAFEGNITYKGVEKLTVFLGFGYESPDGAGLQDVYTTDLWASYAIDANWTVAAEISYIEDDSALSGGAEGYNWLTFVQYTYDKNVSGIFRISGDDTDTGATALKFSVCPTYTFNDNFSVRAEASYTEFSGAAAPSDSSTFYGVQGLFKF